MWRFRKREKIHFDYTHDIHSHVLPGVDDGVRTYGEAIMVLKGLSSLGVKRVTCTSHVYFPALMNGRENLHPLLANLQAGLQKEEVEIELDLGAEYRVGEYMLSLIERGEILSAFTPNRHTHPAFADALKEVSKHGVQILAKDCIVTEHSMTIDQDVPVIL